MAGPKELGFRMDSSILPFMVSYPVGLEDVPARLLAAGTAGKEGTWGKLAGKKLGLIGGTGPESTIIYYRELEDKVCEAKGGAYFPPMTIESLSVYRVLGYCQNQDLDGLAAYLLSGIQSLAAAGADAAAFTGITPHIVYGRVAEKAPSRSSAWSRPPATICASMAMGGQRFWGRCRR